MIWVPSETNLGEEKSRYAPSLEAYADSLAATYGQAEVPFVYAQPATGLSEGVSAPEIKGAAKVEFSEWPKSLEKLATELGAAVKEGK